MQSCRNSCIKYQILIKEIYERTAFKKVVVLDCTKELPGILHQVACWFRATVIKIEKPGTGNSSRRMGRSWMTNLIKKKVARSSISTQ